MKRLLLLFAFFAIVAFSKAQSFERFFPAADLTTVGVYYYPEHWDSTQWERDFKKMAEMGFEFTHFAEFAWAQLEPEPGKYDFAWLDRSVELAAKYNLKVIMCTSTATPPVWLTRKYPEILAVNEDGTSYDHGSRQHATFSNNFYRSYSMNLITELAKRYGHDERIMGWQIDNEPRIFSDFGADAHKRFRLWLSDKYKSIDVLNHAWGTNFWSGTYTSFDQINIPKSSQWGMNLHQRLDHKRFIDHETASFIDDQARVIRKHIDERQWVTTNYIPMYDVGYIGQSTEIDFDCYTRYMIFGSDLGLGRKGYRVGDPTRIPLANDFFRPIKGMYGVMELQPGQVNWGSINPQPLPGAVRLWLWHVFAGGSKFTCTYRFRAPLYGYEQYHYGIVSYDGVTPTPGGLEFSQFMNEIELLRKNYDVKAKLPASYLKRKTGILFNPDNVMAIDMYKQNREWNTYDHFLKYYRTLKSFGAPVDFVRDTTDFSHYPVLIVPAYQQISRELIAKLTKYAELGGNLVMTCRTGHQDKLGHLWEAPFAQPIYDLIGSEVAFYDLLMPHAPDTILFDNIEKHAWVTWGEILKPRQGTTSWASYQGDFYEGETAVTFRRLGKGTVTYVGVDSKTGALEKAVLTKLFNQLNINVENLPEGLLLDYRDGFGIAVNYDDKPHEIKLKPSEKVLIGNTKIPTAGVLVWKASAE
jgi:beta-galactosidase